jgi:phosphoserine aminotransferase
MPRPFNFSAGPATLPFEVLEQAGDAAGSDYIRRTAAETFVRRSDFGGTIPGQQAP